MFGAAAQALWLEIIWPILSAPWWWYSQGLSRAIERYIERLRDGEKYLGALVWWRNLFVPMYGQTDMAGRLISFAVRLVQGVVRSLLYLVWFVLSTLLLGGFFLLPIFIWFQIYRTWLVP